LNLGVYTRRYGLYVVASGTSLRRLSTLVKFALALATLLVSHGFAAPARAAEEPTKVAIIVGPVGEELTPVYIDLAEAAAVAAEKRGATVARAYSPDADAEAVLTAVAHANIVVYFGHGVGSPNPYSDTPDPTTTNGWGLNGPMARGDHSHSWRDGTLAYYGESWIAANARPKPGWVMIYSNACYAPGAGEGFDAPASEEVAAGRVSAYSRGPLVDLGASAYFASDFFEGAAHLVAGLLDQPTLTYGELFATEPRFSADGLVRLPHASLDGAETWLHRSVYFEGKTDYWYAFAGDPAGLFSGEPIAPDPLPTLDVTASATVGFGEQITLYPAREVEVEPGTVTGNTYLGDGSVATSVTVEVAVQTLRLQAIAFINGTEQALVGDGPLAGTWISLDHIVESP
jgi:hypothetical protein